jgi:hypothetical protein
LSMVDFRYHYWLDWSYNNIIFLHGSLKSSYLLYRTYWRLWLIVGFFCVFVRSFLPFLTFFIKSIIQKRLVSVHSKKREMITIFINLIVHLLRITRLCHFLKNLMSMCLRFLYLFSKPTINENNCRIGPERIKIITKLMRICLPCWETK